MLEAIGLIVLGTVMLATAPFRYYEASWKSPWEVARWGLLCIVAGAMVLAWELWQ